MTSPAQPTSIRDPHDDDLPGRPNTPSASVRAMLAAGGGLFAGLIVTPPAFATLIGPPHAPENLWSAAAAWALTLHSPAQALATVVSAFAVLLLTLFIEESLKASDSVPIGTRRNIGRFAFIGGIVTVTATCVAITGALAGGDAGAAVQTVGAACVVLFFAAHIATHSVASLENQKATLARRESELEQALATVQHQPRMSPANGKWALGVAACVVWLLLPAAGFMAAALTEPAVAPAWAGTLWGLAYIALLLAALSRGTASANPGFVLRLGQAAWCLLFLILALTVGGVFVTNGNGTIALPVLAATSAAVSLLTAPFRWMPAWTLTGATRGAREHALTREKTGITESLQKVAQWEATLSPPQPRV